MRWVLALLVLARSAMAQDTLRPRTLEPIVVTAERASAGLTTSTAAVTRISAAELSRLPRATLADLLRLAPGITLVDFDGLGFDPQLMVRGFYGGGEAEYVVVLVDGRPVNQLQTGVVAWDVLPPAASIQAVEIVRGGASSLYGDAAIGGVINLITKAGAGGPAPTRMRMRGQATAGSFQTRRGEAMAVGNRLAASLALDRTRGFRQHATRTAARGQASLDLTNTQASHLGLTAGAHWREFDEPGPQLQSLPRFGRGDSDPIFQFDHTKDQDLSVTLDGSRRLQGTTRISGQTGGELRIVDAVRTLPLAPSFGDTKERHAANHRVRISAQLETGGTPIPRTDRFIVGIEASRGGLDSRYYRYHAGERGDLDTRGNSSRTAAALYAELVGRPSDALRLSVGGRFDVLDDSFEPNFPSGQLPASTTHSAFSPRAGLNLRFLDRLRGSGNLYAAVGRSFKAPTLDQLYDQRNIPIPFPPFEIRTSNPDLQPQHGTSFEAGLYQQARIGQALDVTGSLSGYQMDMKDELDFDVTSFRYVNIGRSRHRGLEAGFRVESPRASTFANYTLQAATSRSGANSGKRLKAIPENTLTAGLSLRPLRRLERLETGLIMTHVSGVYLDDANSVPLPDYTRVDARVLLSVAADIRLFLDLRNLFNRHYSTTGFLDPSGAPEVYLYPAAGRVVEIGMRLDLRDR